MPSRLEFLIGLSLVRNTLKEVHGLVLGREAHPRAVLTNRISLTAFVPMSPVEERRLSLPTLGARPLVRAQQNVLRHSILPFQPLEGVVAVRLLA